MLERSLARVLRALPGVSKEIILVEDASTDGTRDWIAKKFVIGGEKNWTQLNQDGSLDVVEAQDSSVPVRVFFQDNNRGKGAAVRCGLGEARGGTFVIHDADLEYDPQDWEKMWRLIDEDIGDVVYGSRFYGSPHRSLLFFQHVGNRIISFLVSLLNNIKLNDVETCYKMFRREVWQELDLISDDFGFEVEFTSKIAQKKKWRIYELGISYYGRSYEEGKKINWKDGVKALGYIIKFRFLK